MKSNVKNTLIDELTLDLASIQDRIYKEKDILGYHILIVKETGNEVLHYHNSDNYVYLMGMLDIFLHDIKNDISKNFATSGRDTDRSE